MPSPVTSTDCYCCSCGTYTPYRAFFSSSLYDHRLLDIALYHFQHRLFPMHTSFSAHLHYGRVDIGCLDGGGRCRARPSELRRYCCKLSEDRRSTFMGQTVNPANSDRACCRVRSRTQRQPVKTSAIFGFLRGDIAEKTRKKYQAEVDAINKLEPEMQKLSDDELAQRTHTLKQKAQSADSVEALLVEAFAVGLARSVVRVRASMHQCITV